MSVDTDARAMTPLTLSGQLQQLAARSRSVGNRAILEEAAVRVYAAGVLLDGGPGDGVPADLPFLTETKLRELVQGGAPVGTALDDTIIGDLEREMREHGGDA
jgi:hypothetical protein